MYVSCGLSIASSDVRRFSGMPAMTGEWNNAPTRPSYVTCVVAPTVAPLHCCSLHSSKKMLNV